ncbi:MAG: flagellar biosynthesis anti-sigma factor FlgM [Saccharospirillum sp.]
MAINLNGVPPGQSGNAGKARQNEAGGAVATPTAKAGTETAKQDDVVELSDRAQILRTVSSRVQQMPDVDQEKVERIKTAIANGDYKIDYDKLAAAFRRFESGL